MDSSRTADTEIVVFEYWTPYPGKVEQVSRVLPLPLHHGTKGSQLLHAFEPVQQYAQGEKNGIKSLYLLKEKGNEVSNGVIAVFRYRKRAQDYLRRY